MNVLLYFVFVLRHVCQKVTKGNTVLSYWPTQCTVCVNQEISLFKVFTKIINLLCYLLVGMLYTLLMVLKRVWTINQ